MKNILSICIVGKDTEEFLCECIDSALEVTGRIIYCDLGSTDDSVNLAETMGVHTKRINPLSFNANDILCDISMTDWVLFLNSNEKIALDSPDTLKNALKDLTVNGYSIIATKSLEEAAINSFQWIKQNNQYIHMKNEADVSTVEIRIVRQRYFAQFLQLMIAWSKKHIFPFESKMLNSLRIVQCEGNVQEDRADTIETKEQQLKYLRGELSYDLDKEEELYELSDDFLIYSVLTKDDIARYYKGLSMGFGGERMYLTMLHYLAQLGRFEEARNFFEAWKEKWEFFDTPEPYRVGGIIYANLFDIEKAISCFESYIVSASESSLGPSLSLLAKTHLLQSDADKAISYLKRALAARPDPFDDILLKTLEKDNWKPLTLSVCMIVRNEELYVARALESVSQIADEIIVVDTGSTDKTIDILNKFKVKIIESIWKDDFSQARNLALEAATGDYILCIDGDEFIDPRERIKLALAKFILPSEKNIAYRIKIEEEDEEEGMHVMLRLPKFEKPEHPIRLFPGKRGISFDGKAFESVDMSVSCKGINVEWNDIFKISHSKSHRTLRNQRKENVVKSMYDSLTDPELALKGVLFFLKIDQPETALTWLHKTDINNPRLLSKIVSLYSIIGNSKDFSTIIDKSIKKFPDAYELLIAKAELYFAENDYDEVYNTLHNHIDAIKKTHQRDDIAQACYLYGMALLEKDDIEKAVHYIIDARDEDSWNMRYKLAGIYALAKGDDWEGVITAINEIIKEENLNISMTIDDFADLGIFVSKLQHYFSSSNRVDAALLCNKTADYIIMHKLSKTHEFDKVNAFINTSVIAEGHVNA